jgi:hypothetical protein
LFEVRSLHVRRDLSGIGVACAGGY